MFGKKKIVIFIYKSGYQIFSVSGKNKKQKATFNRFEPKEIFDLFLGFKKRKQFGVRLLYADEVSYNLEISKNDISAQARPIKKHLLDVFSKKVPDKIEIDMFSFASVNEDKFLAFAPVRIYYDIFSQAAQKSGVKIELTESVKLSSLRNEDAIVSIANKQLEVSLTNTQQEVRKFTKPKKKSTELIIAAIIILVTGLIIVFVLYQTGLFS